MFNQFQQGMAGEQSSFAYKNVLMKCIGNSLNYIFQNVDEPVIILLFGDTQPQSSRLVLWINVREICQCSLTGQDTMLKHKSAIFLIWANYIFRKFIERASINIFFFLIFLEMRQGLKSSNFNFRDSGFI